MLRVSIVLLFLLSLTAFSQATEKYRSEYARFYNAEDLFEKAKYSAAEEEFKLFMEENNNPNNPYYVKAKYYSALSALNLYHADAEQRLLDFLKEYPESIYKQNVYFELGRFYYQKKKYTDAINWLSQIEVYDLEQVEKEEYYFKMGYAHFRNENLKASRDAFYEIIHTESQYQAPALYYYSHIAYTEKSYQTALEGFTKLKNHPSFKETVPYYIAQIYYLQGKYDMVLDYAPGVIDSTNAKNLAGMSHLIGDAFYRVGKYDEAVPFLEEYNLKSATTRDEDYQLGYAYFKSNSYPKAIVMFDKVAQVKDELGQVALYHIGESYLKTNDYLYARNAFDQASVMSFDPAIEEDALYNYAVLSYKLDYNPFDEAVEAMNLYLDRYPDSKRTQDIYQYLVNVYTTMKNYKSAIASIDRIENKDFKMKNAYQIMAFNAGVELFENGEMNQAIENFKLVKKYPIDPKLNALSLYWIAEANFNKASYSEAIINYRKFLEEPGGYGLHEHNDAYYNIAYCYFKQEDYQSAAQSFRTFTQDETEFHKEKLTDAFLRIGDCYFVDKDDDNAIIFYNKAITSGGGQTDYAKYQIGLSYGFKQNYPEKASTMLDIVNNHNKSPLVVPALFEVAESYRLMDKNKYPDAKNKAMRYYNQLIQDHPNHSLVVDAVFQIGLLQFTAKEYNQAEKQFLKVVREYDVPEKEKAALSLLQDIYVALNRPEAYFDLLGEIGMEIDQVTEDSLSYEAAYRSYEDSSFTIAAQSFKKYLEKFAHPQQETNALFYLASSYQRIGEQQNSIAIFEKLVSRPTNRFTEYAANIVSENAYNKKEYAKAIEFYQKLENNASYPENKLKAQIGLMRCYTFEKELGVAKIYANKVLVDPLSLDNVKIESNYVIGKAELEVDNFEEALIRFKEVSAKTSSAIGAESQYSIALIYHLQYEYKKSEESVRKLMKEKSGYDYWVAKGLILQAKNSIGMDDYVQAEYTINSVLKGYGVKDDGVIEEASDVLKRIQAHKNQEKDLKPGIENTIEIGDGND